MSAPALRSGAVSWLFNHNPFYVISALLMLSADRSGYGDDAARRMAVTPSTTNVPVAASSRRRCSASVIAV